MRLLQELPQELPRPPTQGARLMNPSRHELPQNVSEDRRRAREDTLCRERLRYQPKFDPVEEADDFRRLPPLCAELPSEARFTAAKLTEMGVDKLWTVVNGAIVTLASTLRPFQGLKGYRNVFRSVEAPSAIMDRWQEDSEFGRQRLTGVNPMHVRRLGVKDPAHAPLWEAAAHELKSRTKFSMDELFKEGRLFFIEYPQLWSERVQRHLRPRACLAAPTCFFWADDFGNLMPLAIQLKPPGVREKNPVFTPSSPYYDWLMAKTHVQTADTHVHEGTYHLLETHLVSGAVVLSLYRQVHPDHPLRQLLDPHFEYNLAINELATTGLIAKGGTIDTALSAGVEGTLNAARMHYARWSYFDRSLEKDLQDRGVGDPGVLTHYYYRDDARRVHAAIQRYVESVLSLWYQDDADVARDPELQAWTREASSPQWGIPGFPQGLQSRQALYTLATELIFRAGPQHAAVNNGQFDAYGYVPNMPGMLLGQLPDEALPGGTFTEKQFWKALPKLRTTLAQMGMVWVLSVPTVRTLMHAGESPGFQEALCAEADEIIGAFRRQLASISDDIQRRNDMLDIPYRYLDPMNISRSTDI